MSITPSGFGSPGGPEDIPDYLTDSSPASGPEGIASEVDKLGSDVVGIENRVVADEGNLANEITRAEAAENARIRDRGVWVTDTAYAVNDQVVYAEVVYLCMTAHVSAATFDAANWSQRGAQFGVHPFVTSIGDGTTLAYTVTHNLNTEDVIVTVRDLTVTDIVYPTVDVIDANNISITFAAAPTTNEMRVLVGGY